MARLSLSYRHLCVTTHSLSHSRFVPPLRFVPLPFQCSTSARSFHMHMLDRCLHRFTRVHHFLHGTVRRSVNLSMFQRPFGDPSILGPLTFWHRALGLRATERVSPRETQKIDQRSSPIPAGFPYHTLRAQDDVSSTSSPLLCMFLPCGARFVG